jgi:hypothetical protein
MNNKFMGLYKMLYATLSCVYFFTLNMFGQLIFFLLLFFFILFIRISSF